MQGFLKTWTIRKKDNAIVDLRTIVPSMEKFYTNGLCIKQISLPTMNVKNTKGAAARDFKLCYNNHTMSFIHKESVNDIELSKY